MHLDIQAENWQVDLTDEIQKLDKKLDKRLLALKSDYCTDIDNQITMTKDMVVKTCDAMGGELDKQLQLMTNQLRNITDAVVGLGQSVLDMKANNG